MGALLFITAEYAELAEIIYVVSNPSIYVLDENASVLFAIFAVNK